MAKSKKILIALLTVVIWILLYLFVPYTSVLSISNRKNPSQRIYPVSKYNYETAGFYIAYTHSVNKGRVYDYYKRDENSGDLIMTQTLFVSYGAGIPEPEETKGADFYVIPDGYVIGNINRQMHELLVAVGTIADHGFAFKYYGGKVFEASEDEILLKDYFAPQTSLIFEYKKVRRLDYLTHRIKI